MAEPKPVYCPRCGKEAPLLSGHEEPATVLNEEDELVADYGIFTGPVRDVLFWIDTSDGLACPACSTVEETRRQEFQCERCGAQFADDGSDLGWITPNENGVDFLCPDCQTVSEQEDDLGRQLEMVEEGKRRQAELGQEYPPDLAALAEHERAVLDKRRREAAELNRRLGGDA